MGTVRYGGGRWEAACLQRISRGIVQQLLPRGAAVDVRRRGSSLVGGARAALACARGLPQAEPKLLNGLELYGRERARAALALRDGLRGGHVRLRRARPCDAQCNAPCNAPWNALCNAP